MSSSSDKNIIFYDITMGIDDEIYPCSRVEIKLGLNRIPEFGITIQQSKNLFKTSDDSKVAKVELEDINTLASSVQNKMTEASLEPSIALFTENKKKNGKCESFNISTIDLYPTSCQIIMDSSGMLGCSIIAVPSIALMHLFNPKVYLTNADLRIADTYFKESHTNDAFYVRMMDSSDVENIDSSTSVMDCVVKLIDTAISKYQVSDSASNKDQLQSIADLNKTIWERVKPILENSSDAKFLNGDIGSIPADMAHAIFNTLHSDIFDHGFSLLSNIFNYVCKDFYLWYSPGYINGNTVELDDIFISEAYVNIKDEKNIGNLTVISDKIIASLGNIIANMAYPNQVAVSVPVDQNIENTIFNTTKCADAIELARGVYPESASSNKAGVVYEYAAPNWFIPTYPIYDTATKNKKLNLNKDETDANSISRTPNIETNPANEQTKKAIQASNDALSKLAKNEFYKMVLQNSFASVQGFAYGKSGSNVAVGNAVKVGSIKVNNLFKGILSEINIDITPFSQSTNLKFTGVSFADANLP